MTMDIVVLTFDIVVPDDTSMIGPRNFKFDGDYTLKFDIADHCQELRYRVNTIS